MKLIRFGELGEEKPGVLMDGVRRDCSDHFIDWNRSFFKNDGINKLEEFIAAEGVDLPIVPEHERHAPCIARPGMIMCVGLNYADHASESAMELPNEPIIFGKASNTLCGAFDDVPIPRGSKKTDYEVELGVVLSKDVTYLNNEEEAMAAIAGYCIMNDYSERSFQLERGGQWIKGKSCPKFSPLGPYLCTVDELNNPNSLDMQLKVNGDVRQESNTQHMIFKPGYLIYYLSQFMLLEAGDLISTGTPSGVALGMEPPIYLKAGDVVELSIEGLGTQKQQLV